MGALLGPRLPLHHGHPIGLAWRLLSSRPCIPGACRLRPTSATTATVPASFMMDSEAESCRLPKTHQRLRAFPLNVTWRLQDVTFRKSPFTAELKSCNED